MSSFFTIPSTQKKRKRPIQNIEEDPRKRTISKATTSHPVNYRSKRDESISGSEDQSDDSSQYASREADADSHSLSSENEEEETAAERRLRLAERYLDNVRVEVADSGPGFDAEEVDRDLIAQRLQEDAAESKGRMYRLLADELDLNSASHSTTRWNGHSVTGVATCEPWAYTVSKGLDLIKWKIQELPTKQWPQKNMKRIWKTKPPAKKKPDQVLFVRGDKSRGKDKSTYQGHVDTILCVAASQDGQYVATGGKDRRIVIWAAQSLKCLKVFNQHRDSVTSLVFRRGTNQLYSASKDRTVKIWSLNELAYVETLFGHQDEVVDIAALSQERCVSVGARDRTARLWKVAEETQLVFRGGGGEKKSKSSAGQFLEGSMDRVAMIDEETFVTGGDNGCLSLWTVHKKKPIFTLPQIHGVDSALTPPEVSAEKSPGPNVVPQPQPRWITALATIPYSDVILTGSWDGHLRLWKLSEDKKKIEAVGIVGFSSSEKPLISGIVNDISLFERGERAKNGISVVLATGKEHRLGRWQKFHGKNALVVLEVSRADLVNRPKSA